MSDHDTEALLSDFAVDFWKLLRAFDRLGTQLDDTQRRRTSAQARFSTGRLESLLERAGLQLGQFDGLPLEPGLPVSAINADELADTDQPTVLETIEPAVLAGTRVVRAGRVIGGVKDVSGN